jgi:urease accessory protein
MIAVGLWGAQLGNPAIWVLPVAFPMMMAVGGMIGLIGIPLHGVEMGIAVSAIVLGLMVLLELRINLILTVLIVGFFAIFHGHAHGTELPAGESGLLYSMGFVTGTGCLHGIGIMTGSIHNFRLGKPLLRGAGAFIMIMGFFFLWHAVA